MASRASMTYCRESDDGCSFYSQQIARMRELFTTIGVVMVASSYVSLLLHFAVVPAPGDASRLLLLALFFAFLGSGVSFLAAADIVGGRQAWRARRR